MTARRLSFLLTLALAAPAAGRGDDGSALGGLSTIDTWTENLTGCDAEGDSILETQGSTALYLKNESFFGEDFLNGVMCTDVEDCATKAADDTIYLDRFAFTEGNDDDGYTAGY